MSVSGRLLTVDEAVAAILERARPLDPRLIPLADALGLVLAEPIVADGDLPPFAKATMDGYAVRSADLAAGGEHRFRVVAEITAGQTSDRALGPGEAARIMTGAPLPPGADAVVPVERTEVDPDDPALVILRTIGPTPPGQFRLDRGREMRLGETLIAAGATVRGGTIGLIGSAGRGSVLAIPRPTVTVVPTGDELVPIDSPLPPGMIRNTNGPMLAALVRGWGATDVIAAPPRRRPARRAGRGLPARDRRPGCPDRQRRRLRRHPRSGSVGPGRERRRAGLPQGRRQAGQADLVRRRPAPAWRAPGRARLRPPRQPGERRRRLPPLRPPRARSPGRSPDATDADRAGDPRRRLRPPRRPADIPPRPVRGRARLPPALGWLGRPSDRRPRRRLRRLPRRRPPVSGGRGDRFPPTPLIRAESRFEIRRKSDPIEGIAPDWPEGSTRLASFGPEGGSTLGSFRPGPRRRLVQRRWVRFVPGAGSSMGSFRHRQRHDVGFVLSAVPIASHGEGRVGISSDSA